MTREAENRNLDFKDRYLGHITNSPMNKTGEAYAIGVEPQTISTYTNPNLPQCNLPAAQVPASLFRHAIMTDLAIKCEARYLHAEYHLNGSTRDQAGNAAHILGDIYTSEDPQTEAMHWEKLIQQGQTALLELRKVNG
jgi:hypothetical protein